MEITAYQLAERYRGVGELVGGKDHPLIQWWHALCSSTPGDTLPSGVALETTDEIAWCSSFVSGVAWELRLPRSKSKAARSWLSVGQVIANPTIGWDVAILKRGPGVQPGPEVTSGAPGHVGFFGGIEGVHVWILGGNQGNAVSLAAFKLSDVLGYRRLWSPA